MSTLDPDARRDPSFAEVADLPSWCDGTVGPEHLDENDHVNIQHYLVWAAVASGRRCEGLGLGALNIERTGFTQFTAEYHLVYLGELRAGGRFSAHVRIVDRGSRSLHTMSYVLDHGRRRLAFTAELMALNVDMRMRRTADFPPEIAGALDGAIANDAAMSWPVRLSGSLAVRGR